MPDADGAPEGQGLAAARPSASTTHGGGPAEAGGPAESAHPGRADAVAPPGPRRWLILGGSGSGKSTLARALGARLGLPVVHLDGHFWKSAWTSTPDEEWDDVVAGLASEESWVMDGNYSRTLHLRLPRAEAIILLDRNPLLCLARVLLRSSRRGSRPDVPDDCPERWPDGEFVWWILSYRWRSMPRVLRRAAEYPEVPLTILRSDAEVERFMESVGRLAPD